MVQNLGEALDGRYDGFHDERQPKEYSVGVERPQSSFRYEEWRGDVDRDGGVFT
jgi:hypothetical protein